MSQLPTILITGASGGVGRALVQTAIAQGYHVLATMLDRDELDDLRHDRLQPFAMDVSNDRSVADAFVAIDRKLGSRTLDVVVHAAAIAPLSTVEFMPPADFATVFNVNTLGSVRVLQQALPRLRGHDGRFIFVSSVLGRMTTALVASYSASKHAVEAIANAARLENQGKRVHLIVAGPGVVRTAMLQHQTASAQHKLTTMTASERSLYEHVYRGYLKVFEKSTGLASEPEAIAQQILAIAKTKRPRARYLLGADARIVGRLAEWLPDRWFDALLVRNARP